MAEVGDQRFFSLRISGSRKRAALLFDAEISAMEVSTTFSNFVKTSMFVDANDNLPDRLLKLKGLCI